MNFLAEIFGQIVLVLVLGGVVSFSIWKIKGKRTDFGEFFSKYGEMLAYAGLLVIALIIGLFQWWMS